MAIRIITDTASDMEFGELEKLDAGCVPMSISFGDECRKDLYEITKEGFYRRMLDSEELPKTSQPSPAEFVPYFEEAKRKKDQLIVILLASSLSGTMQSARIAKDEVEYDGIYLIDSCTAACGERFLVEAARKYINMGKSAEEVVELIQELKGRVKILACLETLENLYKGGRLTRTQNAIINVLNIKPVITLDKTGAISIIYKNRGIHKSCKWMVEYMAGQKLDDICPPAALYTHFSENALEFAAKCREAGVHIPEERLFNIGPTIGTHVGTGAFGIAYIEAKNE